MPTERAEAFFPPRATTTASDSPRNARAASPNKWVLRSSMSSRTRQVGIGESPLNVDQALRIVSGPEVGGIALFVGTVRNSDHGAGVVSLDYTQHPARWRC